MTQEVLEIIKDEFVSDRTSSKPQYEHLGMIKVNFNAIKEVLLLINNVSLQPATSFGLVLKYLNQENQY